MEDDVYNTGNLFDSYERLTNALKTKVNDFVECLNGKNLVSFDKEYIAEKASILYSECIRRIPIFDNAISSNEESQGKLETECGTIEQKSEKTEVDLKRLQEIEMYREQVNSNLITFNSFKDFTNETLTKCQKEIVNPDIFKPLQSVVPKLRGHAEMVECLNSIENLLQNNKHTISSAATRLEGIVHEYNICLKEQNKKIELSVKKNLVTVLQKTKKLAFPKPVL